MDKHTWNALLEKLPQSHLLQTWEWGETKSQFGWTPYHKVWRDERDEVIAAALVLERAVKIPLLFIQLRIHYTPKGPLLSDWEDAGLRKRVLDDLTAFARERGAYLLKVDPDVPVGIGEPESEDAKEGLVGETFIHELKASGWRYSNEQVQFKNTVLVDLTPTEDEILARMKQKTRYNVRLAGRKGVTVRQGTVEDFEMLYQMYAETAVRDGFAIRGKEYYQVVWQTFLEADLLTPLIAEVEGEPVAGLMLFTFGGSGWYLYGMSRPIHREKMPTYLLQWEAIRVAKSKGCTVYDLWGAPEVFDESDSLWGVYRFKRGLGGQVFRTIGAWDKPLRPFLFALYAQVWPRVMNLMRSRGRLRTQQDVGNDE